MASPASPFPRPLAEAAGRTPVSAPARAALAKVGMLVGAAWLIAVILQITGNAGALHHHALIEPGAPPLWIGLPVFLVAWQVMIAGMMLPASLRAVRAVATSRWTTRPGRVVTSFIAAYALAWTVFGLLAFVGDMGLHALVHASPWVAARPWAVQAAVLALAGAYQFVPLKRRGLLACRHPDPVPSEGSRTARIALAEIRGGFRAGLAHAGDCLASSWALMLLMFAAGVANLAWMAVLAVVMWYEASGRHGERVAFGFGGILLWLALIAATGVTIGF